MTVSIPGIRDFSPNPINAIIKVLTSFSYVDDFNELLRLRIENKSLTIREPLNFLRLESKIIKFRRNERVCPRVSSRLHAEMKRTPCDDCRWGKFFLCRVTNRTTFLISILFLQWKQLPSGVTTTTKGKAPRNEGKFPWHSEEIFPFHLESPVVAK